MDIIWCDVYQFFLVICVCIVDFFNIVKEISYVFFNLYVLECWGGVIFDVVFCFLYEDFWDCFCKMCKLIFNIFFQMLFCGVNGVVYVLFFDNVIDYFVKQVKDNGVDIFCVFDVFNDINQFEVGIKVV